VALTLSGLPSDRFLFAGFLPSKDKARDETLAELAEVRATLVFFETAPRLTKALEAIGPTRPRSRGRARTDQALRGMPLGHDRGTGSALQRTSTEGRDRAAGRAAAR
jgi:hypothetical protein